MGDQVGVAERLKWLRMHLNKTQGEMARLLGVSMRTYQRFELGVRTPRTDELISLLERGVNINWLLTGEGPMFLDEEAEKTPVENITTQTDAIAIPLLGEVSAGPGIEVFGPPWMDSMEELLFVSPEILPAGLYESILQNPDDFFALIITSDSMTPTLQPGDTVIVKEHAFGPGDIVVIRRDQTRHFVKRLKVTEDDSYIYVSDNPKYPPMLPKEGDVIVGRVAFILSVPLPQDLSEIEWKVARMAQLGLSLRAIAARLGISHEKVRQILKKLRNMGIDLPKFERGPRRKKYRRKNET